VARIARGSAALNVPPPAAMVVAVAVAQLARRIVELVARLAAHKLVARPVI
jgi:hypothetical protein